MYYCIVVGFGGKRTIKREEIHRYSYKLGVAKKDGGNAYDIHGMTALIKNWKPARAEWPGETSIFRDAVPLGCIFGNLGEGERVRISHEAFREKCKARDDISAVVLYCQEMPKDNPLLTSLQARKSQEAPDRSEGLLAYIR